MREDFLIITGDHGWWKRIHLTKTKTCPEIVNKILENSGLVKDLAFDGPYFKILTDRVYHVHLTRFSR